MLREVDTKILDSNQQTKQHFSPIISYLYKHPYSILLGKPLTISNSHLIARTPTKYTHRN